MGKGAGKGIVDRVDNIFLCMNINKSPKTKYAGAKIPSKSKKEGASVRGRGQLADLTM